MLLSNITKYLEHQSCKYRGSSNLFVNDYTKIECLGLEISEACLFVRTSRL